MEFALRITHLFAAVLLMLAVPANASTPREIQSLRDNAYNAATQMIMYAILEKAGERRMKANAAIAAIDAGLPALNDAALSQRWQSVRAILSHEPYQGGEINQLALYAIEDNTTEFAHLLDQRMPRDIDRQQKALYELTSQMQMMMTIYLRNSADPLGGSNYSGINRDQDLVKLAADFSGKLDVLTRTKSSIQPKLLKLKAKWSFLAPRFTNFNQQSVPYVVDLYGRQIITALLDAAATP